LEYKILPNIKNPSDVKTLDNIQLNTLCEEIRNEIIETVSKNGGHLASNLGAVELTVALHRAFDCPKDAIVFDVGHQSYTHKLLTGRYKDFSTLRTENGLSGFMRPNESECDPVVSGHSSTSVSSAYGIYKAKRILGEEGTAVAVIGDGAITGGMAYEGINNASERGNFIIVLNDNKMSISRNVGAMSKAFTRLRNRPRYHNFKFAVSKLLIKIPFIGDKLNNLIYKIKKFVKGMVYKNNVFESLGYNYLGPVDGHNIKAMEDLFKIAKRYSRPSVVHIITTKGKGYSFAESKPKNYHGVSPFDVETGADRSASLTFSDVAGKTLCKIAKENEKICAVTAAMKSGTALDEFAYEYRNRFFDVGIAEQHAVTYCAGLSVGGMIPFFAVYSTFLQRAYDQIIHDCAIANLPVKFLVDRAGIVGEDGETHQGIFDVSFLSGIPNMNIYSPCYYDELTKMIEETSKNDELCAIRYPRGKQSAKPPLNFDGDYTVVGSGKTLVITYGRLFSNVYGAVKDNEDFTVLKLNKIFPLSHEVIEKAKEYGKIYIYEEGIRQGGIGEHIISRLSDVNYSGSVKLIAIDGEFVPAATVESSYKKYHFDVESIIKKLGS